MVYTSYVAAGSMYLSVLVHVLALCMHMNNTLCHFCVPGHGYSI